jgi:predicted adenine nucleotide alpha hydrolase (AANH) superfamily ATPase
MRNKPRIERNWATYNDKHSMDMFSKALSISPLKNVIENLS